MDVIDLYIFDNAGTTAAVVAPIELQHTEQAYTLYARIPGDTTIGDGYAVGFKCIDGRFRIFDITGHTAMEPDGVIEINAIDKAVRELMDEPITDLRPQNVTATQAVTRLISSTRFTIGTVSCANTGGMTAYYESAWDALVDAQAAFDCVLVPYFEITGGIITARKIDILARNGADRGRIFELGDDLADIRVKYDESQIKTALFGRGRGVELDGGDGDPTYGRRLTFADAIWSTSDGDPADKPNGQEWIGDPDALAAYSRDGRHRFGFVTFDSEEDAETLLQKTWDKLQELKQPRITIECTVLDTERTMGRSHEAVRYGDGVLVRIAKRGIDIDAKVSGIVRDYIRPERTKLTIGNAAPSAGKIVADLQATLDNYNSRASVWDRSSAFDIDGAIDVMNNQILSTTGGWYTDKDTGAIVMVSSDGTKAMRLTGAGWQIADEKVGDTWRWRTAATGSGIVADEIKTGTLNANLIRAGTIQDLKGNNYWNLQTGEFRLSSTTTVDGTSDTIGDYIESSIKEVDVEYSSGTSSTTAPVSGWSTTAPAWEAGKYIWQRTKTVDGADNVSYSDPTCIQGADGQDGTSVTVSSIQYGTSSSANTQPSSWSTTVPTSIAKGKWLWVRTTYSDSSTATTKSYIGTDGDDGKSVWVSSASKSGGVTTVVLTNSDGQTTTLTIADGEDGEDGQPGAGGYVHTAWANSADGQTDFSTSVSAGKKYLGVYTDHTQTDSQVYSDYSWSLIKGADGQDGTSISSIIEQYYLSTSSTTRTGGSWSSNQPAWESGKYIWTRSRITWATSPPTTTTTTPVLAQALNGANSTANTASSTASAASSTASAVADQMTQQGIFNILTDNGVEQGIYLSNGKLYINATYIQAGGMSMSKLATGAVFTTLNDSGITIRHTSAGNSYTTLDANGLRVFDSNNNIIGGLYVPTGQSAVQMGATSLFNPNYPNFSAQIGRQYDAKSDIYIYSLSFYRQNTFAFSFGVEDDANFAGGFIVDKLGQSASLDAIINVAKNWDGYDPGTFVPSSALSAQEVQVSGGMHLWQEYGNVYLSSPGDVFIVMHLNGGTQTLRMSDVYDLFNP